MAHILPRDMLLRQIYFGFLIHAVTRSHTQHVPQTCTKTKTKQNKKACNHTQGDACAPLQSVTQCFQHSHLDQKVPEYHHHILKLIPSEKEKKKGAASECELEGGKEGFKQRLHSDCEM